MRNQLDTHARGVSALLAAMAACTSLAVSGCGGTTASSGAAGTKSGGTAQPVAISSATLATPVSAGTTAGSIRLTGNLCVDAAAVNRDIRALTEALVTTRSGRQQQARKLIATIATAEAALASEAPGPLKTDFAKVASFYRAVETKLASSGGQLTLSDFQLTLSGLAPASHPGMASAIHQVLNYFATHCAA